LLLGTLVLLLLLLLLLLTTIGTWPSVKCEPSVPRLVPDLVLSIVNEVPSFNKVSAQVLHDSTMQTDGDIRPTHSGTTLSVQLVLLPVRDIMEVKNPRIVVVLTGEDGLIDILRVSISNGVLVGIPATEAKIQATHESDLTVNQAQLLVVGPVQNDIVVHSVQAFQSILGHLGETSRIKRHVLQRCSDIRCQLLAIRQMIGVAEDCNIRVEVFKSMLGVGGGQSQGLRNFLVDNDVDTHATLGRRLQHSIQTVLLILGWGPSQVQLRGEPPYGK
jgi:hypothetical protein